MIEVEQPPRRRISKLEFLDRFTQSELEEIELQSVDTPSAPQATRRAQVRLRVLKARLDAAPAIDLFSPSLRASLEALEASGVLSPGRAAEILRPE